MHGALDRGRVKSLPQRQLKVCLYANGGLARYHGFNGYIRPTRWLLIFSTASEVKLLGGWHIPGNDDNAGMSRRCRQDHITASVMNMEHQFLKRMKLNC